MGDEYISDGILSEVSFHLPPNEASGVLATKTMHCWRLMGFDWDNSSPDPDIGSDTFSAWWWAKAMPRKRRHAFTTTAADGVWPFVSGKRPMERCLESLTGFSGREVGALCAALREIPVAGKCRMFDTKREKVIW